MKKLWRFGLVSLLTLIVAEMMGPQNAYGVRAAPLFQDPDCDTLYQDALVLYNQARFGEALSKLQDALTCYRGNDDRAGEGRTLNDIGVVYHSVGQYEEALEYYEQALAIRRAITDQVGEGTTLSNIGGIYKSLGRYEESLEYYKQALAIQQDIDDRAGEGSTLNNIGVVYHRMERYEEALDYYEQALSIQQYISDPAAKAATLNNIGGIYHSLGRYEEALDYYEQALAIRREIGDRAGEGVTLNNIGGVYKDLGWYEEALGHFDQALAIHRDIGAWYEKGATLNNIGLVHENLGQYEEALEYYQQALVIVRKIGHRAGEGTTLNNIGSVYHSLGRYERAMEHYEQAMDIRREIGDQAGESLVLHNAGAVCDSQGRHEQALRYYEQALVIEREIGDRAEEGATLNNIGAVYFELGWYEEALDYYKQSLVIRREIDDRAGEATTLNNIGGIYHGLGQYEQALNYYEEALVIQQETGDQAGEGATLNNIGYVCHSLGRHEEALDYFVQALAVAQEIGDSIREAATLNNIGGVHSSLGRYEEALDYYQQAFVIQQEIGARIREGITLNNIGLVYDSLRQYEEALDYYERAISLIETVRGEMHVEEIKTGFAAQHAFLYDGIIELLVRMERPTEAFDYVQRAKARSLLDQLGNVRVSPLSTDDTRLNEEEEALRGEIRALDSQLREEWAKSTEQRSEEAIRALAARLEEKRAAYAELLLRIKLENPEYASLVTVNTLTLTDTQELLVDDTTLVEYYVLPERILTFVVTRDGFQAVPISVTQESLVENVQALYAFPSLEGVPPGLQALYQDLFAPVVPYIRTDLVVIAPHGVVHYVPFAALHNAEHYLVERFTLFYTPSASVLPFALEKRKAMVLAPMVLGDPDGSLPNARREAQAIAGLYSVAAYVGEEAQERLLWEEGAGADFLHLSTHGVYDFRSPLFSHVVLAPDEEEDGRLVVYEIYNRGLNLEGADLVVLSACQTSLGALTPEDKSVVTRGDEIVGLNRALIYAGAPSVIASLWTVDDASTRELMVRFYTHLQEGMSKAGALRAAQMESIAEGTYAHPYYWAAFGVTGDAGEGKHVLPEMLEEATPEATPPPEDGEGCIGICPAAVLPLGLVVLASVRRKRR